MSKENVSAFLKKYTMVIVLVIVTLFFTWKTGGRMLLPQNVNNLISQNSYVFILATGMLLCILTGECWFSCMFRRRCRCNIYG